MSAPKMLRYRFPILLGGGILLGAGGPAGADCLPTLGTDGCFRWDYFQIQPLEHRYFDAPTQREPATRHIKRSNKKATNGAS